MLDSWDAPLGLPFIQKIQKARGVIPVCSKSGILFVQFSAPLASFCLVAGVEREGGKIEYAWGAYAIMQCNESCR